MIEFDCPHCGKHIRVKDDLSAGQSGKCQHCRQAITVPSPEIEAAAEQSIDEVHAENLVILKFVVMIIASGIALVWLAAQAVNITGRPERYLHRDRFDDSYADPAAANAVESMESTMLWLADYGSASIEFWLIIIAGLLVLLIVQTERLLIRDRRQP